MQMTCLQRDRICTVASRDDVRPARSASFEAAAAAAFKFSLFLFQIKGSCLSLPLSLVLCNKLLRKSESNVIAEAGGTLSK